MSTKKLKTVHNKDVFQRVNFLYQASQLMADKNPTVSSMLGNLFQQLQKKSVLKIDPTIKRNFCRRCSISLTPGTSEISSESDTTGLVTCLKCGFVKKYPINDSYALWSEMAVSTQEILDLRQD